MEIKKKWIFNIIFLLLIFAATLYGVFHGKDMGRIIEIIKTVNPFWLIPGVICVIIFIWGESIIIHYLMHSLGIKVKKWICFLFSSVGFFFSCITPSASGGQPAQVYYMKKEDIPIPISTMVLLIITIIYKMVLVLLGIALVIFGQGFILLVLSRNGIECGVCSDYGCICISSEFCEVNYDQRAYFVRTNPYIKT